MTFHLIYSESFRVALLFICQGTLSFSLSTLHKKCDRRRRDLNPRAAINDLHPFQGCPFSLLGTSPRLNTISYCEACLLQRRGWDSNPRALADKRFSRPPRYDHFDTSPHNAVNSAASVILTNLLKSVNTFFKIFFLKISSFRI